MPVTLNVSDVFRDGCGQFCEVSLVSEVIVISRENYAGNRGYLSTGSHTHIAKRATPDGSGSP